MRLNAPKKITWWIALIVGVVGVILHLIALPMLAVVPFGLGFWLLVVAFVLLLVATYFPGL
jgi:hypothetical protein